MDDIPYRALPSQPPAPRKSTAAVPPATIHLRDIKTVGDRWVWHAEVYAFRRVVMGIPYDEHTSPCDPKGEWFDQWLVDEATERYRKFYRAKAAERVNYPALARKGREICDEWARARRFADFECAQDAGHTYAEVVSGFDLKRIPLEPGEKPREGAEQ